MRGFWNNPIVVVLCALAILSAAVQLVVALLPIFLGIAAIAIPAYAVVWALDELTTR